MSAFVISSCRRAVFCRAITVIISLINYFQNKEVFKWPDLTEILNEILHQKATVSLF